MASNNLPERFIAFMNKAEAIPPNAWTDVLKFRLESLASWEILMAVASDNKTKINR